MHGRREATDRHIQGGWIDPDSLPRVPGTDLAQCRWCSDPVPPPRMTFCSAACVHEHRLRTNGTYMRRCVYQRDRGVCAACGSDTKALAKRIREMQEYGRWGAAAEEMAAAGIPTTRKVHGPRKLGGGLWDADHKLAVWQRGGISGLENLQTLCIPCHRAKTSRHATQRATERAAAQQAAKRSPEEPKRATAKKSTAKRSTAKRATAQGPTDAKGAAPHLGPT